MYKSMLFLCFIGLLLYCNKKDFQISNLKGKWEADYLIDTNLDTTFFREGTVFPCAYIVLPGEYNSGFEIMDGTKGELIWCGGNKGQFFTWSLDKKVMTVQFDGKTSIVTVENLTDSSMDITIGETGKKYRMIKN